MVLHAEQTCSHCCSRTLKLSDAEPITFYQTWHHKTKIHRISQTCYSQQDRNTRFWQHPIVIERLKLFLSLFRTHGTMIYSCLNNCLLKRKLEHGSGSSWQCSRWRFKRDTCHICLKGTSLCFEMALCCADKVVLFDYSKKTDSLPSGCFILYCKEHVQEGFFPNREIKMQNLKSLICG